MGKVNYAQLVVALQKIGGFARRIGADKDAKSFEKLHTRLRADKCSSRDLQVDIFSACGLASIRIPDQISKQRLGASKKEQLNQEYSSLKQAVDDALFPPKLARISETDIQGLAGNDELTKVTGDPKGAETIAKRALDVVQRFSTAVFKQDIETAYGLCANELRTWMSVKRFVAELEKSDQRYGGKPVACKIERISWIEADEKSRQKSGNKMRDWPKDTPKSNKRAIVGTFWVTNPAENRGRWVMFWVTEEAAGYRIAKMNQYLQ